MKDESLEELTIGLARASQAQAIELELATKERNLKMTAKALAMAAVRASGGAKRYRAMGVPYYWRDEASGELARAVRAYFEVVCGENADDVEVVPTRITEGQLELVRDYLVYWVHAPCWGMSCRGNDEMTEGLVALRARSLTLASVESIKRFIEEGMELGLDGVLSPTRGRGNI